MKKILLMEDDENVRANIVEILENEGFFVIAKENGRIGYETALEMIPDLIISDVMMPELDGFQVIEKLRQNSKTAEIPFIFLTARAERNSIRNGMNIGADDYITKPFTVDDLLGAVSARLAKKNLAEKKIQDLRQNLSISLPHELRTPLMGMIGFSQLLRDNSRVLSVEEIHEMSDKIYKSGQRLLRLVQNYLLYTELFMIEKGINKFEIKPERSTFDAEIIKCAINSIAEKYERIKDTQIEIESCEVLINGEHLLKVVEEIAENCFKFSKAGTKVQIKGETIKGEYLLIFTDNGIGIKEEQLKNMGAFVQFDRHYHEQQGSGLGFIISKMLVNLYGGKVTIQSRINEYTKVEIELKKV
jgi:DNA-binding response OmpR family regulator